MATPAVSVANLLFLVSILFFLLASPPHYGPVMTMGTQYPASLGSQALRWASVGAAPGVGAAVRPSKVGPSSAAAPALLIEPLQLPPERIGAKPMAPSRWLPVDGPANPVVCDSAPPTSSPRLPLSPARALSASLASPTGHRSVVAPSRLERSVGQAGPARACPILTGQAAPEAARWRLVRPARVAARRS